MKNLIAALILVSAYGLNAGACVASSYKHESRSYSLVNGEGTCPRSLAFKGENFALSIRGDGVAVHATFSAGPSGFAYDFDDSWWSVLQPAFRFQCSDDHAQVFLKIAHSGSSCTYRSTK